MLAQKFFADSNVFVRNLVDRPGLLVPASFLEMLAIERTVDGIFALRAAAGGADFAAHTGAVTARSLLLADLAGIIHQRIVPSYHRSMPRTDVYIKVELDVDERERPERVASEICRQIRKVYGVRSAEVSSMVEKDS